MLVQVDGLSFQIRGSRCGLSAVLYRMVSRPGRPLLVQDRFRAVGRIWVVNVWDHGQDSGSGDVDKEKRRGGGGERGSYVAVSLKRVAFSLSEAKNA